MLLIRDSLALLPAKDSPRHNMLLSLGSRATQRSNLGGSLGQLREAGQGPNPKERGLKDSKLRAQASRMPLSLSSK